MRKLLIESSSDSSLDLSVINSNIDDSSASDVKGQSLGQAGTDHPWYKDFDLDISADFEDNDAYPFAYFPVNPTNIKELKFFISNGYDSTVHNELFGNALEEYICNFIHYKFDNGQERFCELMGKFYDNTVEKDGLKYGYRNGVMMFSNEKDSVDFKDVVGEAFHYSGIDLAVPESLANAIYNILEDSDWDNGQIVDDLIDYMFDHFDLKDEWDQDVVCGMFGIDINGLFNSSRLMGRIWTDTELITFYPGQQPSRDEMKQVISDISNNIRISEDDLLDFYTIFEVGSKKAYTGSGYKIHDDAQIQCCTVADYIEGKYSGFNREEEIEMVKNRKGVDRFCPHLANQEQKREFFKDFRKTRDNAVYVPREKGAGSLAAYHAMRYPYGESKDVEGELIKEEYSRRNEAGTDSPYYCDPETGFVIEGDVDDGDACPFGFFPYKLGSDELRFFTCEDCDEYGYDSLLHANLIGAAIRGMVQEIIQNDLLPHENEVISMLSDLVKNDSMWDDDFEYKLKGIFKKVGISYVPTIDFSSCVENYITDKFNDAITNGFIEPVCGLLYDDYGYEPDAYGAVFRIKYHDILFAGRLLGRVWTDKGLITFYPGQQPSRDEMKFIIDKLAVKLSIDYDEFLGFHTIFEVGSKEAYTGTGYRIHDDAQIQCCTVADYIEGKYSGFNRDEEYEMVKNRTGVKNLNIHLAKPEEKREFFKDFRKTRDNAVYVPREKGAGSLAAYHAMRYPYGENKDVNGMLVKEERNRADEAGTDSPYFYDPDTQFEIGGSLHDDDACPFGYFPCEPYSDKLALYTCDDCYDGDEYDGLIHRNIVNTIVRDLAYEILTEDIMPHEEEVIKRLDDMRRKGLITKNNFGDALKKIFKEVGIRYVPTSDFSYFVKNEVSVCDWDDISSIRIFDDVWQDICDTYDEDYEIGIIFGIDDDDVIRKGRLLGRIWTDKGLITFYPGQQPSRDEMKYLLNDLSSKIGIDYDNLLDFHIIFETGSKHKYAGTGYRQHEDATVQCCTVADYIEGKYSGFNRDEEYEMVKNRKGVENLNIHLAKPEEKREFFKDFRKTRDNAVYAPREKGAGSLAAYHAMRYPYGENKDTEGRLIKEEYGRKNEAGTDHPFFYDAHRGRLYEGHWQDVNNHPFAYFESAPGNLEFFVGDGGTTHFGLAYHAANDCYLQSGVIDDGLEEFTEYLTEEINKRIRGTFNLSKEEKSKVLGNLGDICMEMFKNVPDDYKGASNEQMFCYVISFVLGNGINDKTCYDTKYMLDKVYQMVSYSCRTKQDWEQDYRVWFLEPLFTLAHTNSDDYFDKGRLEGRIFPKSQIISFYQEQQPTSSELNDIIKHLSSNDKINISYNDLLEFEIIYEDNDGTVTGCSVSDYISNKPLDSVINPDERQGSVFIPHLAKPEEKREFFKDFRDARDKAVYAPREKAAGSLAAYHAMRYPYGESKKVNGKLIKEDGGIPRISDSWMSHVDDSNPSSFEFPSSVYPSSYMSSSLPYSSFNDGTDFPRFYDVERGRSYEGFWQDNGTHPFAFFESSPGNLMFHVGGETTTHSGVAYYIAKNYYLKEKEEEIKNRIKEVSEGSVRTINYYLDLYFYKNDGPSPNVDTVCDVIYDNIDANHDYYTSAVGFGVFEGMFGKFLSFLIDNKMYVEERALNALLYKMVIESCGKEGDDMFDNRLYFLRPLFTILGENYDDYFYRGRLEGRIFTESELISFYAKQQPTSAELDDIVRRLSKDPEVGVSYDDILSYEIIYKDKNGVTGCPVYEYIMKKPLDNEINPDERQGSVFIPHLAKPEEKREFFKDFRDARDKAVYAPREKAAGTLAAYHAMRYPYGENKQARKPLIREGWWSNGSPCAGTDHPYYEDKETGEVYEANWDDGYGFPFGYWPVDKNGKEEFSAADYGDTHAQACGKAAEKYFHSIVDDLVYECADDIHSAMEEISDEFKEYGYTYDEEEDRYVSSDGDDTVTRDELVDRVYNFITEPIGEMYDILCDIVDEFLQNETITSYDDIAEMISDNIESDCYFYDTDEIDKSLGIIGSDFYTFFEEGHSEGRIWPEHEMIGFYDTQQPSPDELEKILYDLADYMGCDYDDFMNYHMIYEDWDGEDDTIKLTTLGDYINGPHEEDKQYAKDGKTVFIPHLAKPEEKRDFFKDFRDTRDRVKFVPQEKAAGTIAAYHAMKYPFGESKKRIWKQVSEEVERVLSNSKRVYVSESALKRIAKSIKGKKMSSH